MLNTAPESTEKYYPEHNARFLGVSVQMDIPSNQEWYFKTEVLFLLFKTMSPIVK